MNVRNVVITGCLFDPPLNVPIIKEKLLKPQQLLNH